MSVVSMKQLLEAGVHFGHQTRRWNPKMAPYIYTERNGIYIIDLQKTVKKLEEAYSFIREISANGGNVLFVGTKKQAQDAIKEEAARCGEVGGQAVLGRQPCSATPWLTERHGYDPTYFVREISANGGNVLFVGTKKQAQDAIREEAARCGGYYVNSRWLGGMMTNFRTMRSRIDRLAQLKKMEEDGTFAMLPKKEVIKHQGEIEKLEKYLGGVKEMKKLPAALFIVDQVGS